MQYSPRSTFWFYTIIATRFSILSSILLGGVNILVESFWLNTSMIRLLVNHYLLVVWWHVATSLSLVPLRSFGQDVPHKRNHPFVGILDYMSLASSLLSDGFAPFLTFILAVGGSTTDYSPLQLWLMHLTYVILSTTAGFALYGRTQ